MAGYLLSNKKLREELSKAKDAEAAAKLLGRHLQRDGKKLAKQIQDFVESDDVQRNVKKAKDFTKKKVTEAKAELKDLVNEGKQRAAKGAGKLVKKTTKKRGAKTKRTTRRGSPRLRSGWARKAVKRARKTSKAARR